MTLIKPAQNLKSSEELQIAAPLPTKFDLEKAINLPTADKFTAMIMS